MRITAACFVGPYRVDALIGKGSMGEVYRAYDARLDRRVALKVLATGDGPSKQEHVARFAQEARVTAIINHPNLLTVYDVGTHEGTPFVVSELLEGETLRARLAAGRLPAAAAIAYARQIAEGLLAAHRLSIVHRDLKPENIFVTVEERVKILDFGLAGWREEIERLQDPSVSTRPCTRLGTVGYMSPEQIRGHAVDARSDLFSLGAVLYEMVAGAPAFHGESPIETLGAILQEEPPSLSPVDGVPPELDRVVRHCLEKDRGARFQSARDLSFALDLAACASRTRPVAQSRPRHDTLAAMRVPAMLASLLRML